MRYRVPHENVEFEIPDPWLESAGIVGFSPKTTAYPSTSHDKWSTTLVRLDEIEAPRRDAGVIGLHEDRTVSLLKALGNGTALPPLEIHEPPEPKRFRYRVRDGYHRYYLSIAIGFTELPVSVRPYFDFYAL